VPRPAGGLRALFPILPPPEPARESQAAKGAAGADEE